MADLSSETSAQLLAKAVGYAVTIVGGLCTVIAVLWKTLVDTRKELAACQQKYEDCLKERNRDSELFLRALERRRSPNSDTPPDSPKLAS